MSSATAQTGLLAMIAMCSINEFINRAASVPLITRWSYERDNGRVFRHVSIPPIFCAFSYTRDIPMIANSGALMMGVERAPPTEPGELSVKQPPDIRSRGSPLVRAKADTSLISSAISAMHLRSASRMTGRYQQTGGCFNGNPNMKVLFEHKPASGFVKRSIECREGL